MNIKLFRTYGGIVANGLDSFANELAVSLNLEKHLERRDSSYSGGYCKIVSPVGFLNVSENYNAIDDEWFFSDFKRLNCIVSNNIIKGKKAERLSFADLVEATLVEHGFELIREFQKEVP